MKFIELFAGIGGFRLGLERTGHECVWASEWLSKPASIYEYNFNHRPDERDIRTITASDIPDADLIVGGFPCATFSVAGKRAGFSLEDTRGTLCFEMFRLARDKGIPYILFENVKGLLNHDGGRTFRIMLTALDEMGYDAQWELLDSQHFGVPQHRERLFVVGNLRGKPRPKVFPISEPSGEDDRENRKAQRGEKRMENWDTAICPTLDANYFKGADGKRPFINHTEVTQWRRGYFRDYKSEGVPTLTANMGTGGHNVPFVKQQISFVGALGEPRKNSKKKDIDKSRAYSQSKRVFGVDGISPTLSGTERGGRYNIQTEDKQIRKLTPVECERLQGLPDDWTKYFADGTEASDSERYERCGRTVSIPVIEAIGKNLYTFYE